MDRRVLKRLRGGGSLRKILGRSVVRKKGIGEKMREKWLADFEKGGGAL